MPKTPFRFALDLMIMAAAMAGIGLMMGPHILQTPLDVVGILGVLLSAILVGIGFMSDRQAEKQPAKAHAPRRPR